MSRRILFSIKIQLLPHTASGVGMVTLCLGKTVCKFYLLVSESDFVDLGLSL